MEIIFFILMSLSVVLLSGIAIYLSMVLLSGIPVFLAETRKPRKARATYVAARQYKRQSN